MPVVLHLPFQVLVVVKRAAKLSIACLGSLLNCQLLPKDL